jgi:hypothetical protein
MNRHVLLALSCSLALTACSHSASAPSSAATNAQALAFGPGAPSGLAYAVGRPAYRAGRAITPNTATVNGTGIVFTAAPALPAGLALDGATGTISGTPTDATGTSTHTVTASNANGSTTSNLRITVVPFGSPLESARFGQAPTVRLVGAVWGRLVDVYDRDNATGATHLVARDLLVRHDLPPASIFAVQTNIATQGTRITIDAPLGSSAFADTFDLLESNLPTITPMGPGRLPPFPTIPRNAGIALIFDDLIDPATLSGETLRVHTGVPSTVVQSARLATDPNHGNVADRDGDGQFEFWSTRVLIDPLVTELEVLADAQPLALDPDGYPPSSSTLETNLLLRIPTVLDAGSGQLELLRNLAGSSLSNTESGPVLLTTPTLDVARAMRSGGPTAVTGDPQNGFMLDFTAPRIVAEIPVSVTAVQADPAGNVEDRRIDVQFADAACAGQLRRGDAVQVGRSVFEVLEPSAAPVGATVSGVRAKILLRTGPLLGAGTLSALAETVPGLPAVACALRFDPAAGGGAATLVDPAARLILRSDEPLDRASLSGMDATRITRVQSGQGGGEIVPADHTVAADLRGIGIRPLVPLTHTAGSAETYHARIGGWSDLAGNPLTLGLADVPFALDPAAAGVVSGGVTFVFDSSDMLPGPGAPPDAGSGKPEFRGQFLLDAVDGIAKGRPVSRFQVAADRSQAVPSFMTPFTPGVGTPISRYGSKVQTLWRYCDVGLALLDEQFHNVDVEHLYWAPAGGTPVADAVTRFEMSLSHGGKLPDESLDQNLLPGYPSSGLVATYAQNVADPVNDPLRTVHPGASGIPGYAVQPSDATTTTSGTVIMPWPLNQGLPLDRYERYTWRDTALQATGGANGPGAELSIVNLTGAPSSGPTGGLYPPGSVPSIGLPLLMEFRCYPDSGTFGLNAFDVSLAVNSSPRPNFRAFSAGGMSTSGSVVIVDPDLSTIASGGFNPNSTPTPGAATPPLDNVYLVGAMDVVVRVSRMHSIWIDSTTAAPELAVAIEPPAAEQPPGTGIELAFRGAIVVVDASLRTDADALDAYGDPRTGTQATFFQGDPTWKASIAALNGARFVQARVTFVANAATNATPELSALGIAWR